MKRPWLTPTLSIMAVVAGGFVACTSNSFPAADLSYEDGGDYSTGVGPGSGAGGGSLGGSTGPGGPAGEQSVAPPQEEPEELVACEALNPSEPLVLYLSADDSNSMGSPVLSRELIRKGAIPTGIRTYEFLNYYNVAYDAPEAGTLAVVPQMAPTTVRTINGEFDLQIGVRAPDRTGTRRPLTLTLVLDTSGSMGGDAIEREAAVVQSIAHNLAEGDIVNVVTWSVDNAVVLAGHTITGADDPELLEIGEKLTANGGTDLHGGLVAGYALATEHFGANRLNRVVLVSDGGANVGVTDANLIGQHADDQDAEGIYMVGIGTGPPEGYSDVLMDTVTDKGRGAYVYVDSAEEAQHVFDDRFAEVFEVAARGVQIELTAPWYFQMHRFYGEEYSENPEEVDPQHLAPGDAMVLNQVLKACSPDVVDHSDTITITATWNEPLTRQPREASVTMTVGEMLNGDHTQLAKGRAIVAYAEALKDPTPEKLAAALAIVNAANHGDDPHLLEIASLIEMHPQY